MSLNTALNAAVSGLSAQSDRLSAIADNIANSSTTAYKTTDLSFQALVNNSGAEVAGSVTTTAFSDVQQQGTIESTDTDTNLAINGDGFFVVSSSLENRSSAYTYSRNGDFTTDADGYLVNDEGNYLLGQLTNTDGAVIATNANDINSLEPVNVNTVKGAAKATTTLAISANLPADAATGAVFTTSTEIFDSLGISSTIGETWTKTAANTWSLALSTPVLTSDGTTVSGTMTSPTTPIDISFNGDGSLASTSPSPITIGIDFSGTGDTGAADSSIALNLGTVGGTDGLTQDSSETSTPEVSVSSVDQDGLRYGKLSSVSISSTGLVTAKFDNGLSLPVYQIPIATFSDADALTHVNGSVYAYNSSAGTIQLQDPDVGTAGSISPSSLEDSTTDTSTEMDKMIVAQQAYSAASKLITTVDTMYTTLLQAIQ
jgi:flagellar hook protein FlgE